jgi:DNA-nicking Smr family endonuclease
VKSFEELASLKARLANDAQRRATEAAEQRRREAQRLAEANVFREAVGDVRPLPDVRQPTLGRHKTAPVARQRAADEVAALEQSMSDEIDIASLLDTDEQLSFRRPGIGPDVVRRLRKGEWTIKSQIDLHGLRVDEARSALVEFLQHATRNDQRCVRVIHGKGLGSLNREPVLKGKVLKWLVQRQDVLAFCQARPNDGGAGAVVVLLSPR